MAPPGGPIRPLIAEPQRETAKITPRPLTPGCTPQASLAPHPAAKCE